MKSKEILIYAIIVFLITSCKGTQMSQKKEKLSFSTKSKDVFIYRFQYHDHCLHRGIKLDSILELDTTFNEMISEYFSYKLFDADCEMKFNNTIFDRPSFIKVCQYFCDTSYNEVIFEMFGENEFDYIQMNKEKIFKGIPIDNLYQLTNKSLKWDIVPYGIYALWEENIKNNEPIDLDKIEYFDEYLKSLSSENTFVILELICFLHNIKENERIHSLKKSIDYKLNKECCDKIFNEISKNKKISFERAKELLY